MDMNNAPDFDGERTPYACASSLPVKESSTESSQGGAAVTEGLPVGTQAWLIDAARLAHDLGTPLTHLLTLRPVALAQCGADGGFLAGPAMVDRIKAFIEKLRKHLARLCGPPVYIWVREASATSGEHLHVGIHLPDDCLPAFIRWIQETTGAQRLTRGEMRTLKITQTEGEIAHGDGSAWHLARDTHPERQGRFLAAYLGKGEPSCRRVRGKWANNEKKPVRARPLAAPWEAKPATAFPGTTNPRA